MPPAKKPTPTRRRSAKFKEPAALRRLAKSLDVAHEALADLRKHTGRDVSQGARDVYKDLRTFVASARRDSGKLAKALARDFEQAERRLGQPATTRRARAGTTATRATRPRAAPKRSAGSGK
jgi:hypothetical protein